MGRYINPFTDFGFKKLFGEEANKKLLISFLNDILPISKKIVDLSFKKNEQQGDIAISRKAVYDIFCEDESGSQFIVEMQNAKQLYFKDRAIFYSTFPIRDAAKQGDWDFKLNPVYCVGLLGFEFDNKAVLSIKEDEEIVEEENEYYHRVQLKDHKNRVFYEKLNFVFVELPKFKKKENELISHCEKWLYFLKNLDSFENIPEILKEEIFEEAFKVAEVAAMTPNQVAQYEESLKIYRDNINVINTAKKEGYDEGKIEVAKNLLGMGMDIVSVIKATGLEEEDIKKLKY
jgi:predicted transposase/invertase (TIGR01784 family)